MLKIIYNSTDPLTVLIVCKLKLLPKILISYNPICFLFCFQNFVKLNIEIYTVLMSFSKMMFLRINESAIKTCSIFVIPPGIAGLVFLRYHFCHPTVQEPSGLPIFYQHKSNPWPGLQRTPSLEFNLHFKSFLWAFPCSQIKLLQSSEHRLNLQQYFFPLIFFWPPIHTFADAHTHMCTSEYYFSSEFFPNLTHPWGSSLGFKLLKPL